MHQSQNRTRTIVQCKQRSPMTLAENKDTSAIDRIDHPGMRIRPGFESILLAQQSMLRIHATDLTTNRRLSIAIGNRHWIKAAGGLVVDVEARTKVGKDFLRCDPCKMDCEFGELS